MSAAAKKVRLIFNGIIDFLHLLSAILGELSFKKGDRFNVLSTDDPDWWKVRRVGAPAIDENELQEGYVPSAYMVRAVSVI